MSASRDGPPSDDGERTERPASSDSQFDGAATDGGEREREGGSGPLALVRRFRHSDNEWVTFVREVLSSAGIVVAIGLVLFAVSGVWPPMVAIESGSMQPHMQKGDLVFIMEEGRLEPDGNSFETPIIHRARFWVEEGENWYDEANAQYLTADSCEELTNCPAPNAGFITKGDANAYYDQSNQMRISSPVKPSWVRGTAEVRIPWLGWVRLQFSGAA